MLETLILCIENEKKPIVLPDQGKYLLPSLVNPKVARKKRRIKKKRQKNLRWVSEEPYRERLGEQG